ncbi:MAG: peptidase [Thermoplasmata archaeon]|nr:MAG: peptidase [Thermoplasmata archaeon]
MLKIYYSKPVALDEIEKAIRENFGIDVKDAGMLPMPEKAYEVARGQYNAAFLVSILPPYSIWIVDEDIYVDNMNFVFGLAMQNRAVVSCYRLPSNAMIAKEVVHEVGHIFGLSHCKNECVMQFSNSLAEAMKKPGKLCEKCKRKIRKNNFSN